MLQVDLAAQIRGLTFPFMGPFSQTHPPGRQPAIPSPRLCHTWNGKKHDFSHRRRDEMVEVRDQFPVRSHAGGADMAVTCVCGPYNEKMVEPRSAILLFQTASERVNKTIYTRYLAAYLFHIASMCVI
jgi:hypothetical protein